MSSIQQRTKNTAAIKSLSDELGFIRCGISKATQLESEAKRLEEWLTNKNHGSMQWMENHFDKRIDPRKLVEGSKSVVSFTYNYFPEKELDFGNLTMSKYAYGKDYHFVLKEKLKNLIFRLQEQLGEFDYRIFVDSAPVMDKVWAAKSGLGWIGKNSNLISTRVGSFFFIAEIITDLEFEYDHPVDDRCGTCTRCIDACPTQAITEPYVVDGSKCISYLTIELKDQIPDAFKNEYQNWMFGCDICQDVCPWNRFSTPHQEPAFNPSQKLMEMTEESWIEITEDVFKLLAKESPLKRPGFERLKRNIDFVKKSY